MARFWIWGSGPVSSSLIRSGSRVAEWPDRALAEARTRGQRLADGWCVEVEAEEEYVDLATRDDPAAIGWERLPDQESNIRPACARCEFWTAREYEAGRFGMTGVCRRYPPSLPSMEGGKFPITHDRNWCGEFRPMTRRLNMDAAFDRASGEEVTQT